jgi:hypothetical protein
MRMTIKTKSLLSFDSNFRFDLLTILLQFYDCIYKIGDDFQFYIQSSE